MEAELLPDGRVEIIFSRRENGNVSYSLLEALPWLRREDSEFHTHVGLIAAQAGALEDEWSILKRQLFGLPQPPPLDSGVSQVQYKEYVESLPEVPRKTGTTWDDMPKMEAELLTDRRIVYILARGELSIFAGAIDVMLVKVARDRDLSSRGELSARSGGTIEEFEALRDELWRADHRLRGKPAPNPIYDPPHPKVSSGRVGDVATFAAQHRLARVWSREREPVSDEQLQADLTPDGQARIVVSALRIQRLEEAFWPWHSMYWDEPGFVGPGGASIEQAQELRHEISRICTWLNEEWRERWTQRGKVFCEVRDGRIVPLHASKKTRKAWGDVLVAEAEVLPDERIALILPLVKLKVLVGYMEVSLTDPQRYRRFYWNISQEEAEALADDLWQAYEDLSRELSSTEERKIEGEEG